MTGLTSSEVLTRRERGEGNDLKLTSSRSYTDILKTNVFNPVNVVLYAIGAGMVLVGDVRSAISTVMLVAFNAVVGIVQEVLAKRKLDQIALLARAKVTVRRDGQEQQVDPAELVRGDMLVIRAGDQIPVDGVVSDESKLEVDESALTGESDLIAKVQGDQVLSGSFCVTGSGLVEATRVGEQSFANQLTQNARQFKLEQTPLQNDVNRLLRILLLIVAFYGFLAVLALFVLDLPFELWLQILAVITGSVSAGLLVFVTLNYSWGAVRIGQQGGLVQQINAVESLRSALTRCTRSASTRPRWSSASPTLPAMHPPPTRPPRRSSRGGQATHGASAMRCPSRRRASGRGWPSMTPACKASSCSGRWRCCSLISPPPTTPKPPRWSDSDSGRTQGCACLSLPTTR
jgi:cation-transporting ATPase E